MMNKRMILMVAALVTGLACSGPAMAQASQCGVDRDVKPKPLDEPTWRRLNRIYEFVGEEEYDAAYDELVRMNNRAKGDYLRAIINQALAQVLWAREDFDAALKSFELAVELDALPDQTHFSLMYQIAQLYYMKERFQDALDRLDLWFCKAPPEKIKPAAYVLKASIHAQTENWPEVIKAIDVAIDMDDEPKEPWYQLKLAANFEMQDFRAAAKTLDVMVTKWPAKKVYWTQLSNVHFKLEDDDKALSVIALAYREGLLDAQADLLYLSNLYSFRDVPYKAADVMQKGLEDGIIESTEKHWTMVADAWYAAEELEKSLAAFEKAGAAATDGEIDLRRGYILIDLERWEAAREALTAALDKGGINERKTGEAHLMVGMAEFNLGNYDAASSAWGRASRFERSRNAAQQWMNHLREERARKAS